MPTCILGDKCGLTRLERKKQLCWGNAYVLSSEDSCALFVWAHELCHLQLGRRTSVVVSSPPPALLCRVFFSPPSLWDAQSKRCFLWSKGFWVFTDSHLYLSLQFIVFFQFSSSLAIQSDLGSNFFPCFFFSLSIATITPHVTSQFIFCSWWSISFLPPPFLHRLASINCSSLWWDMLA